MSEAVRLLERAARDGHTGLPARVLQAAGVLPGDIEDALSSGRVLADDGWLALDELATAESAVADEVLGLAAEERLALVLGPAPPGADVDVVRDVHRLSLEEVAAALQSVPADRRAVLAGDPDVLPGSAPGAVLADLLAWGRLPVRDVRDAEQVNASGPALARLPSALRRGELPEPDPGDHSVVVVACTSDGDVVRRADQLVRDSLPRVFGTAPEDVLVLSPVRRGEGGVGALGEVLSRVAPGVRVATVHEAATEAAADAVVLCLPGHAAGTLSRPLVLTAVALARRHISVVSAVGEALPHVVIAGVVRRRRTALLRLLRRDS